MKKFIAILLVLTMVLAFAGCAAKYMTHEEYMAADLDSEVVIETYVQATQSWWEDKITVYCQSPDGAYFLYELACSEEDAAKLVPGTKIRVTGFKGEWAGEVEVMDGTFTFVKGGDTWIAEATDVTALLGTDELIKHQNELVSFTGLTVEGIEYKNLTFSYDGERNVLKNINLKIQKGKTVALVGQSGSGKSTMVDLIPRYYDVEQGEITIDGVNIKDMKVKSLRGLIGNVNQEAILFNDSFYNNITFGVENATMEQVIEAAKIANAHDFIMATENGYDTNVGDRGCLLSGGQRQRISIARAILKNPPILILDEATSALDTESERLVQEALERLMKSRTTIAIAHRLSTIKNADEICVLRDGEIVERGTHEELLEQNGVYKRLNDMQSL